jgi:hypothetical protein
MEANMVTKTQEPTLATWRARLIDGTDPRLQGGLDGHQGLAASAAEPTPFQFAVHARAWECCNDIETGLQHELAELATQARDDPFALPGSGAVAQCTAEVAEAIGGMSVRLHEDHSALVAARRKAEARERDRNLDFMRAGDDAKPPPNGWPSILKTAIVLVMILCLEVLFAYWLLLYELGPERAILYGAAMPFVTMAGGGLAGSLTLRPALKEMQETLGFMLRRAAAFGVFLLTLAVIYGVAALRASLVAGQDGTAIEAFAMAMRPLQVIFTMEALGLALLGVAGFLAGRAKLRSYYGGFVPALRASDLAYREAARALLAARDDIVAYVTEPARGAKSKVETMYEAAMAWAKAKLNIRDLASMAVLDANRRTDDLNRALASVDSEYRGGYAAVRQPHSWTPVVEVGSNIERPALFEEIAHRALEASERWSTAVVPARGELDTAICDAIAFLDVQAGFEPKPPTTPGARVQMQALSWRRAA